MSLATQLVSEAEITERKVAEGLYRACMMFAGTAADQQANFKTALVLCGVAFGLRQAAEMAALEAPRKRER